MAFDYQTILNWPIPESVQEYSARDTILYALGVGAVTTNPPLPEDLRFVYENGLQALPTMQAVLAPGPFWMADPKTGINVGKLLHGEQFLTLHKPLPAQGRVVTTSRVDEVYDKGPDKGAVMYLSRRIVDADTGDLLSTVGFSCFLRGNGGFGGRSEGAPVPHRIPDDRPPDASLDLLTRPEQAAIYRLSGDLNPLHIDPGVSALGGFDRPILHGMCSYGVAGRAVLKVLCGNDPARLRRLDVRFATPVYPGETLRTEIWRESDGRAAFRVRVVERDVIALNNGYAEFLA